MSETKQIRARGPTAREKALVLEYDKLAKRHHAIIAEQGDMVGQFRGAGPVRARQLQETQRKLYREDARNEKRRQAIYREIIPLRAKWYPENAEDMRRASR